MSELEAVIAEEKAKLVESKKLRMLYLDEEDMIEAGVMDAAKCVDVMEETMGLLEDGDFIMGGPEHNSHMSQDVNGTAQTEITARWEFRVPI